MCLQKQYYLTSSVSGSVTGSISNVKLQSHINSNMLKLCARKKTPQHISIGLHKIQIMINIYKAKKQGLQEVLRYKVLKDTLHIQLVEN